MAIAEQFAGLKMEQLIGGPLRATADASIQLASSTAEFINNVGFDKDGKVRTVAFGYQRRSMNEDGTSNLDEMKVDVPMLAIVPIPNLQVDEVNILFDMEVKQSERSESSLDAGVKVSGSGSILGFKVSVTGSVSTHQSNTRSSDNSAKYHVDVRATNHGMPEGLARVLDMMAANVAPMLVGSSIKDGNGQNLSEQARVKAERLKALRYEISAIEKRLGVAREGLDNSLSQLRRTGDSQMNIYNSILTKLMNGLEDVDSEIKNAKSDADRKKLESKKAENEKKMENYSQSMNEIEQSWSGLQNRTGELVKLIADSSAVPEGVSELFALRAFDDKGDAVAYGKGERCYSELVAAQTSAVNNQKKVSQIETELFNKKEEYSDAVAGKVTEKAAGEARTKEPASPAGDKG